MKNSTETEKQRKTWQHPWGYKESFFIALDLLILSFVMELFFQNKSGLIPSLPWSIILFLSIFFGIGTIMFFFKSNRIVKWLASVPAAIASIALFFTVSLFMGIFPQAQNSVNSLPDILGLTNIVTSWQMFTAMLFLLITLGFTAFKRLFPLKKRNIGFLLNHLGLWILLASAAIGSIDMQRLKIQLFENNGFSNVAIDNQNNMFKIPFEIKLIDFDIDEYNPKLLIFNPKTEQYINKAGKSFQMIFKGYQTQFDGYKLRILDFIKYAQQTDSGFVETTKPFSTPAALIEIEYPAGQGKTLQWITSGGFDQPADIIELKQNLSISLSIPEPKEYSSILEIKHRAGKTDTVKIIVNKPHNIEGYRLYQHSYNSKLGKWSNYSIIEIVHDPWLPIVYVGFVMLGLGSLFMIWWGRKIYTTEETATKDTEKKNNNYSLN